MNNKVEWIGGDGPFNYSIEAAAEQLKGNWWSVHNNFQVLLRCAAYSISPESVPYNYWKLFS